MVCAWIECHCLKNARILDSLKLTCLISVKGVLIAQNPNLSINFVGWHLIACIFTEHTKLVPMLIMLEEFRMSTKTVVVV